MDNKKNQDQDFSQTLNIDDLMELEQKEPKDLPLGERPVAPLENGKSLKHAKINLAPSKSYQKKAKRRHLAKKYVFTKKNIKYIAIGIGSFLIFALFYNLPVIFSRANFALKKPETKTETQKQSNTPISNEPEKVSADNLAIIPKINVTSPVIYLQSRDEKEIQLALRNGVVHYGGTALPGQIGNSVIVGHSSNDLWEPGNYKYIFANLDQLTIGDKIQLNYNSGKYQYEVFDKKVVEANDLSVLNQTSEPILTLITCTPPGTSWRRLIVSAKQFDPIPDKDLPKPKQEDLAQPKTLPSNAPSIFDQISNFFNNLF